MKTAVSIPDDVYVKAERLARRSRKSRSELYSDALREYTARHASEEITDALDKICDEIGGEPDATVHAAGRRALERTEW
jgi:metal-responsive CopG/Arc/MetJ family transcriptional regulator